jgi:anti-sigma factor RsiW
MSGCQFQSRLGAYHDGELDDSASQAVEHHLAECEICADELAGLREVSQAMAALDPGEITPLELARLHRELDRADDGSVIRLGVGLAAAAASILIISLAWIGQTPARPAQQANSQFQPVQQLPEWQRLAMGGELQKPVLVNPVEPKLPDTGVATNDTINWMLNELQYPGTHASR